MKRKIIFLVLLPTLLLLSGCVYAPWYRRHPADQPGTTWATEDRKVVFYIEEEEPLYRGVLRTEDGGVEIVLSMSLLASDIGVSYASALDERQGNEPLPEFEVWICEEVSKTKFVVKVKTTTYFEVGQELIFYRVEE